MGTRRALGLTLLLGCWLALGVALPYVLKGGASPPAPLPYVPPNQPQEPAPTLDEVMKRALEAVQAHEGLPRTCNPPLTVPGEPTGGVVNVHCRIGPAPDYYAEGKAMGMSDEAARDYAARTQAAMDDMVTKMLSTVPPPPR